MSQTELRISSSPSRSRLASVDAFRGLTILTMIFVNEVGHMEGVPLWMRHSPGDQDGMTFVDVVFPAFLFIMGMAIPLAIGRRLDQGESRRVVAGHVLKRVLGLLVMGLFMVNMSALDTQSSMLTRTQWSLLVYLAFILVWNEYPWATPRGRRSAWGLRGIGVGLLVFLAIIFKGKAGNEAIWMRTSWWGILGLIGWAYFFACLVYGPFRRHAAVVVGAIALGIGIFIADKTGVLDCLGAMHQFFNIGGHIGCHTAVALAGTLAAMLVVDPSGEVGSGRRILRLLIVAVWMFAMGFMLRRGYGINKNAATPTWGLYSAGFSCLVYTLLYWLMDVRGWRHWAFFLRPAGTNSLLAFIMPGVVWGLFALVGLEHVRGYFNVGNLAILRSAVFALAMVGLTGLLARGHVRLRV